MSDTLRAFYGVFGKWLSDNGASAARRKRFIAYLKRAVEQELPKRDNRREVMARDLRFSDGLRLCYSDPVKRIFPDLHGGVSALTVAPDWRRGWRFILKDDFSYHYGSWFFHLATQYVHRSRQVSFFGGAAIVYGRGLDFFGKDVHQRRIDLSVQDLEDEADDMMAHLVDGVRVQSKNLSAAERRFGHWAATINGLDPFVHRVLYQFVRGCQLWRYGFEQEATAAWDAVLSACTQFGQHRLSIPISTRTDFYRAVDLPEREQVRLTHLYALRTEYGAHPGWAKWWDFGEMFESWFEPIEAAVVHLIAKTVQAERRVRAVNPEPERWSEWFEFNARTVFDAVWWRELPV